MYSILYIFIYIHICVYTYICVCEYIWGATYIYLYIYMRVYIYVCVCIYMGGYLLDFFENENNVVSATSIRRYRYMCTAIYI